MRNRKRRREGTAEQHRAMRGAPERQLDCTAYLVIEVRCARCYRLFKAKFHYTDPTGPARTFFAAKLRWVRAGPVGSV